MDRANTNTTDRATTEQANMDRTTMEQVAMNQVMLTSPHQAASACVLTVDNQITTMMTHWIQQIATGTCAGAGAGTGATATKIISPHPAQENFHGREAKRGLAGEKDEVRAHGELMVLTPSHTARWRVC